MATLQEKRKHLKNWLLFTPPVRDFLNNKEIVAEFRNGMKLAVRGTKKSDFFAMTTVCFDNVYEVEKMNNPKVILDIGANIGAFTIVAARLFPDAKVIAVEPEPSNSKLLRKNIALNKLTNVEVIECAVSNKVGEAELFIDTKRDSAHSFFKEIGAGGRNAKSIVVPTVPLSHFGKVDAMKIDCEGAEFLILNNNIPDCQYVAIEFDDKKDELEAQFKQAGYTTEDGSEIWICVYTK